MNIVWFVIGLIVVLLTAVFGLWIFGERGHLMLPSTRRAMGFDRKRKRGQAHGEPGRTHRSAATHVHPHPTPRHKPGLFDPIHAYVYARWTNQYIQFPHQLADAAHERETTRAVVKFLSWQSAHARTRRRTGQARSRR